MHLNHSWLPILTELRQKKIPCILITVVESKGSTPRDAGTKMVVTEEEIFGTIGGGNLEFQSIDHARALLQKCPKSPRLQNFALGPSLSQCCGGAVTILLEPFIDIKKTLYLFGAGHVGKEVIQVLASLPINIKWIDTRPDEFPSHDQDLVEKIVTSSPNTEIDHLKNTDFILIMTHDHDLDYEIVFTALQQNNFAYLGLIGSKTKRVKFEKKLVADGIDKKHLNRLTCPIGIEGMKGKHPREIAISVAAQLIQCDIITPTQTTTV